MKINCKASYTVIEAGEARQGKLEQKIDAPDAAMAVEQLAHQLAVQSVGIVTQLSVHCSLDIDKDTE